MSFRFYTTPTILPILKKSLKWRDEDLSPSDETIEIVIAAGKYEWFLKKIMNYMNDPRKKCFISHGQMEHILSHATSEQIEKMVLPYFKPFLDKNRNDFEYDTYQAMPIIFNKVSLECLETLLPSLFKFCGQERTPHVSEELLLICAEKMNAKMVEEKLVPGLLQIYEQAVLTNRLLPNFILKASLKCIEKLDADILEARVVPELQKLYKRGEEYNFLSTLILKCVDKMSTDALRRSIQPDLESRFSNLEGSIDKGEQHYYRQLMDRDIAFVPYLALISRFNKEENDKISERLLRHLSINLTDSTADNILTFLKALRSKNGYVNDVFYQAVEKIVYENNENCLQQRNYYNLHISHMTKAQVEHFIENEILESERKKHTLEQKLHLETFKKFSDLPMDVYPMQLRIKSLKFLQAHLDDERVIYSLPKCLKTDNASDPEFRNILMQFAQHAIQNIESICKIEQQRSKLFSDQFNRGDFKSIGESFQSKPSYKIHKCHYCTLLEGCVSIMTDEELITYILPKVREMLRMCNSSIGVELVKSIKECLKRVFSQIKNEDICREFFNYFITLYIKEGVCSDLFPILSEKVDLNTLQLAYRKVLSRSYHSDYMELDRQAYLLALFSKRIPNNPEIKEERHAMREPEQPCSMM